MIEINLLPGSGKKKTARHAGGGGVKFDPAAALAVVSRSIKDKYLAAAVASVIVAGGAIGAMTITQSKAEKGIADRETKARADSTHYAAVLADKVRAEAKRDTVLRQLNIIRAIDDDRYIWPHILDEVSRALPSFTWLTNLRFSGTPQGTNNPAAPPPAKQNASADTAKKGAKKGKKVEAEVPHDTVQVRLSGETVDIQAFTRFLRQLGASPFLTNIQIQKSDMVIDQGQQVTEFDLTMTYMRPDSSVIRRVPLTGSEH